MQASSLFDISLYLPTKFVRKVIVRSSMKISSLRISAIPKDISCTLIFNGSIIDESKTFEYYQIKKDDVIVISLCKSNISNWTKISENQDNIKTMIRIVTDSRIANEICRLKDIRFEKLELIKPSKLHKIEMKCRFIAPFNECSTNSDYESMFPMNNQYCPQIKKSYPTVIPDTIAEKPFDEALTFIWNE